MVEPLPSKQAVAGSSPVWHSTSRRSAADSARDLGSRGRGFESRRLDHSLPFLLPSIISFSIMICASYHILAEPCWQTTAPFFVPHVYHTLWYKSVQNSSKSDKCNIGKNKKKNPQSLAALRIFLVRVAGFEPTASWSRTKRATNCATPGCSLIIIRNFPADVKGKSPAVQIVPARHIPRQPVIHCGRD